MPSQRQARKNHKQALRRIAAVPHDAPLPAIKSIEQQINDLPVAGFIDNLYSLSWEEIVADRIPLRRAARQMQVSLSVASEEMEMAAKRLQFAGCRKSAYPIDSFAVNGLDGVPRREYVPAVAANCV